MSKRKSCNCFLQVLLTGFPLITYAGMRGGVLLINVQVRKRGGGVMRKRVGLIIFLNNYSKNLIFMITKSNEFLESRKSIFCYFLTSVTGRRDKASKVVSLDVKANFF